MAGTLDGKRAIVTGGGQGVGRGIALGLVAEGAAIALVGRTESTLLAVAAEIEKSGGTALPIVADVTRAADIQRCVAHTVSELGGIDILVNNAQIPVLRGIQLGFRHVAGEAVLGLVGMLVEVEQLVRELPGAVLDQRHRRRPLVLATTRLQESGRPASWDAAVYIDN